MSEICKNKLIDQGNFDEEQIELRSFPLSITSCREMKAVQPAAIDRAIEVRFAIESSPAAGTSRTLSF